MLKWLTLTKLITYILLIPLIIRYCSSETGQSTPNPDQQKDSKSSRKCITLYIDNISSFPEYKYSIDGTGKIKTFEAYENFAFNKIVGSGGCCNCISFGDQTLWETQSKDQSAIKVVLQDKGSGNLTATVTFQDNSTKTYSRPGKCQDWKETSSPDSSNEDNSNALKPVELDLNNDKKPTSQYEYKKDDSKKTVTYTAKASFGFSKVKESPSNGWIKYLVCYCCFSCCCKSACFEDELLWETNDPKEYATKVEIKSDKNLTVCLADKSKKEFVKGGCCSNQWTEVVSIEKPKEQNLKANE